MRTRRTGRDFSEPSLNEMLDDPVVQVVMARDGVKRREIVAQRGESPIPTAKDLLSGK